MFAVFLLSSVGTTSEVPHLPYRWNISPLQHGFDGQNVKLAFSFRPDFDWIRSVTVNVKLHDGIGYTGPTSWKVQFQSKDDSNLTVLSLVVPSNDTSEIDFVLSASMANGMDFDYSIQYCFVTQGDSIEYWKGDPRFPWIGAKYKRPKSDAIDKDTLRREDLETEYEVFFTQRTQKEIDIAKKIIGFSPKIDWDGSARVKLTLRKILALWDEGIGLQFAVYPEWGSPRDTTFTHQRRAAPTSSSSQLVRLDQNEANRELMKRREQAPLNDKTTEGFFINGEMWQRNYGETKFRKVEPLTDVNAYLQRMNDSLNALPDDHLFDICLTLSETGELSKTKGVLGQLPEPVDSVHYHVKLTKLQIAELAGANIRLSYIMNGRCYHDSLDAVDTSLRRSGSRRERGSVQQGPELVRCTVRSVSAMSGAQGS